MKLNDGRGDKVLSDGRLGGRVDGNQWWDWRGTRLAVIERKERGRLCISLVQVTQVSQLNQLEYRFVRFGTGRNWKMEGT